MAHTSAWQHLNSLLLDIYINNMQSFVLKAASTYVFCNPFKGVVFKSVLTSLAFYIFYHIMSIGCTVVLHKERQLIYHSSLVCHHSYMYELLSDLVHMEERTRRNISCCDLLNLVMSFSCLAEVTFCHPANLLFLHSWAWKITWCSFGHKFVHFCPFPFPGRSPSTYIHALWAS